MFHRKNHPKQCPQYLPYRGEGTWPKRTISPKPSFLLGPHPCAQQKVEDANKRAEGSALSRRKLEVGRFICYTNSSLLWSNYLCPSKSRGGQVSLLTSSLFPPDLLYIHLTKKRLCLCDFVLAPGTENRLKQWLPAPYFPHGFAANGRGRKQSLQVVNSSTLPQSRAAAGWAEGWPLHWPICTGHRLASRKLEVCRFICFDCCHKKVSMI